jgi:uncharacterized YigZ family protein
MKTIAKKEKTTITIKKSTFISRIFPVKNVKEAKKIIFEVSEKYKDATHNCSAFIVTDGEGFDDDGEPGGTAGKPMLNVLKKNNLNNILAIVTRYFGGIKLGAGGLVRAYSNSVQETLSISETVYMEIYEFYEIIFDYPFIKTVDSELRKNKIRIIKKDFKEKIFYEIAIKKEGSNKIKTLKKDNSSAQANLLFKKLENEININFLKEDYLKIS